MDSVKVFLNYILTSVCHALNVWTAKRLNNLKTGRKGLPNAYLTQGGHNLNFKLQN